MMREERSGVPPEARYGSMMDRGVELAREAARLDRDLAALAGERERLAETLKQEPDPQRRSDLLKQWEDMTAMIRTTKQHMEAAESAADDWLTSVAFLREGAKSQS